MEYLEIHRRYIGYIEGRMALSRDELIPVLAKQSVEKPVYNSGI
jgi:hypothetical protein